MFIPDYYEFCCRVNLVAGHDALEQIPQLLASMDASSPMILTDKGVAGAGLVEMVVSAFNGGLDIRAMEDGVPPDSDIGLINRLARVYREKNCDSIIAVGGGSVLDTAKGINILVSEQGEDLLAFSGVGALKRPLRPFIAIPTTAGTGSEVTQAAVIADPDAARKLCFVSYFLLPDAAVVDPRMTLTLPPHITAATAMDAMAHAVESRVMLANNPISATHAHEAISMIAAHLPGVMENPEDKEGRLALATAATMAGMAFSNSMVGMVHALGHSVGSVCHVPHGTCMAIFLPYGLEYNLHRVGDRIADLLLPLAGPETYVTTPAPRRARAAIDWLRSFNADLNRATNGQHAVCLKDLKDNNGHQMVPREQLPQIARTALGDGASFYNPEEMDYDDFFMVAEAAWEGIPLDLARIKKG